MFFIMLQEKKGKSFLVLAWGKGLVIPLHGQLQWGKALTVVSRLSFRLMFSNIPGW